MKTSSDDNSAAMLTFVLACLYGFAVGLGLGWMWFGA